MTAGRFGSIVTRWPPSAHLGPAPGSIGPGLDPPTAAWFATVPTVHLRRGQFHDPRVRPGAGRRAIRFAYRRVPGGGHLPGGFVPRRVGADLPSGPSGRNRSPADNRTGPRPV